MDKGDLRNKRRQDKHHKKVPVPKPGKGTVNPKPPTEIQHTAPLVVCDYRYGKRQIEQNWTEDRDIPSDGNESEDEQLNAADFEKLLSVPPSSSGHFLLSSEKHWLEPDTGLLGEDQKNRYSEYFRIDTKLLNASLGCVPFYQRHGYDESLFSALELNMMRQKADINTAEYNQLCQEQGLKPEVDLKLKNKPMPLPSKPAPVPCLVGKYGLPKNTSEQVPSTHVLKPKIPQPSENPASQPVENKTVAPSVSQGGLQGEELQKWLDDLLEI